MNIFTYRSLGINHRNLGLSMKQLSNKSDKEVAKVLKNAARKLIEIANELE